MKRRCFQYAMDCRQYLRRYACFPLRERSYAITGEGVRGQWRPNAPMEPLRNLDTLRSLPVAMSMTQPRYGKSLARETFCEQGNTPQSSDQTLPICETTDAPRPSIDSVLPNAELIPSTLRSFLATGAASGEAEE